MRWKIWKKSKLNSQKIGKIWKKCDKIWKVWMKNKLNSERIWKIWKKSQLNSEMIWKIQKKIVKRQGKYGRNPS